ncbi:MAG: efflux RND transporter periplasmic adaptor subunit [Burkholderiales bacterium]|nr:efflux RND transporter periplasmic adaptor subunit [Burkholderiales bacterium]
MNKIPLLIATAALVAAGCSEPTAVAPAADPVVDKNTITFPAGSSQLESLRAQSIEMQPVPSIRLNGRLTWNEDSTVRVFTPFAGRVERILVQPGQTVTQGQPLAVIASPDFGQAQADARRAESDHALAEKNLARMRELEQHGVAAKKELQAAEAEAARSKAEYDRNRARLKLYGNGRGDVDQTYTLVSPIAGTVVERNINPGQELRPDQMIANAPPLFVVTNPATLWAVFDASERDLAMLRIGKRIQVSTPAYRDERFPARVEAIADFLDPATRTLKVRTRIDNPSRKLKGEMFVTAEAESDGDQELLVPTRAVYFQAERHYLFIETGQGRYERREVKIGDVRGDQIEILLGLQERESVVVEGSLMLQQVMTPRRVQK